MFLEATISVLAGLGLFFIGVKGLAGNLSQLASRSLRVWVARSTGSYVRSAFIGMVAGALTQSTNAITVILMSLASADLISLKKAMPILAWANVGTALLVFLATADMHLLVYVLVGITGFCFYLNLDRSPRWRPVVSAVLALGLLLLGIGLMRTGSEEFRELEGLRNVFHAAAQWPLSALLIGAALAFVAQSSATVTVIAITMTAAQLLTFEQAMLTVYGAGLGSAVNTYAIAAKMRGASGQLALFQVLIKIAGVGLLIAVYIAERIFDGAIVAPAIRTLTTDASWQIALIYLLCQIASVAVQLAFGTAMQPLLGRLSPNSAHEGLAKPRYIYDQALDDPETALTLVDREQARIFALLPPQLGLTDASEEDPQALAGADILATAQSLDRHVADFLRDLADTGAERSVLEAASERQGRGTLLTAMHEALASLTGELDRPFESPALNALRDNLREGLGALLLTALDAVRSLAAEDIALMRQLTGDRDSVVDHIRRGAIAADQGLTAADHRRLYTLTSQFELFVWLLRRYAASLASQLALVAALAGIKENEVPAVSLS